METMHAEIGTTGVRVPPLIVGTSALGNLYAEVPSQTKAALAERWFEVIPAPVCLDSAGKYGAGLALQEIGRLLRERGASPADVVLSNKLGWKRVPLEHEEPRFEPGVWKNLTHDAEQAIDYDGIMTCWRQGNELLGDGYRVDMVSVHDPDEYLAAAKSPEDRLRRRRDVVDAYRALSDLKADGRTAAVGIGAKDWSVIRELVSHVDLDWVMFAGSYTVYTHPDELATFMRELSDAGVFVMNSAVFHAGFLVGGRYFDYREAHPADHPQLFDWREAFLSTCRSYAVDPAHACVEFGLAPPAVRSVALNTAKPNRVADNMTAVTSRAPDAFWEALRRQGLIRVTPREMRT